MRQPGLYLCKLNCKLWLVEELEHYERTMFGDEFSLIIKGSFNGEQNFNRCLIEKKQYELFEYIGEL